MKSHYGFERKLKDYMIRISNEIFHGFETESDIGIYRNGHGKYALIFQSRRFDEMEITKRQELVWEHLRKCLSDDERVQISAAYTIPSDATVDALTYEFTEVSWP